MNIKETIKKNSKLLYPIWHNMRLKINEYGEKRKKQAYDKYGHEALKKIMHMVIDKNYPCVAIHGTLLGLVRDNHLIPWDDDLDFAIINQEEFDWDKFTKDMKEIGFDIYRIIEDEGDHIHTISYIWNYVVCDVYSIIAKEEKSTILYYSNQIDGIEYKDGLYQDYKASYKVIPAIKELEIREFNGVDVKVPKNAEDVLEGVYGGGWKTPNKGYDTAFKRNLEGRIIKRKITYHA